MSDGRARLFDQGLQLERTALAWRRTALALAVAALASVKVLFGVLGYTAIAVGGVGLALAVLLGLLSGVRYRRTHRWLTRQHTAAPGAATLALCVTVVTCAGLAALTYVLASALT